MTNDNNNKNNLQHHYHYYLRLFAKGHTPHLLASRRANTVYILRTTKLIILD